MVHYVQKSSTNGVLVKKIEKTKRQNKMKFCEMKAVGKQFTKQWMDMAPHEDMK